ncbi:hypothetical protein [Kineococcus radiotolerans]|uniref:Uncharacterized protein n=1 Tax=Kineococcus radiotolerans (strain ATCC BAA-149 / DSM 14245 / SRS30216) TaxID=266940 RepID=A6WE99_KINRD|nr:hypothetical protein [Kineococcus radiotolerans]ABS05138.1 hypothetical protein Krad_3675 [Kineococcus radiotolerans SRS30216 = ATCC BAA-149]
MVIVTLTGEGWVAEPLVRSQEPTRLDARSDVIDTMSRRIALGLLATGTLAACAGENQRPLPPDRRLSWAPPSLDSGTTIEVTATNHHLELDARTDYRLRLPSDVPLRVEGGLVVIGGRNVVIVGGEIQIPEGLSQEADEWTGRRGLYLKDQSGVVHVEGLRFSGDLAEGIDLAQSRDATVQLQNISVDSVRGSYEGNHADLLQVWAGPRVLRVDGFSGTTDYQGFFLLPNQHYDGPRPDLFDLRRVRIRGVEGSAYLLWAPKGDLDWLKLTDVRLAVDDSRSRKQLLRPVDTWSGVDVAGGDEAVDLLTAEEATMPEGTPGLSYRSPGYRDDPLPASTPLGRNS